MHRRSGGVKIGHHKIKRRIAVILTVMPLGDSMKRKRRPWIRFTLRSLLVAVTIVGILLALRANKANNQRHAVAAVLQIGGFVQYDHQHGETYWATPVAQRTGFRELHSHIPSRFALKLRDRVRPFLGTDLVDNVVTVGFSSGGPSGPIPVNAKPTRKLTEEEWGYLHKLQTLEEIQMFGAAITDEDMPFLSQVPNLRVIVGGANSSITDVGIKHLENTPSLEIIQLQGARVSEAASDKLDKLPNIRSVTFAR
jgi:hypothetical protein